MRVGLTHEQLSRVLSAHAAGQLVRYGSEYTSAGCVNQYAFEPDMDGLACVCAHCMYSMDPDGALWFDDNYETTMTPEELLAGVLGPE